MATPEQVIDGIEQRLGTITGLRVHDYVPETITPPHLFVPMPSINYEGAMGKGLLVLDFEIYLFLAKTVGRAAQKGLLPYISTTDPKSIHGAIWADRTLGLTNTDCVVRSYRPLGIEEVAAYGYWGGVWTVTAHTKGT